MADYQRMYRIMFRTTEYAVRQLEGGHPILAKAVLRLAQSECEEIFIETDDTAEDET